MLWERSGGSGDINLQVSKYINLVLVVVKDERLMFKVETQIQNIDIGSLSLVGFE